MDNNLNPLHDIEKYEGLIDSILFDYDRIEGLTDETILNEIEKVLSELSQAELSILELRYGNNLTLADIGKELGIKNSLYTSRLLNSTVKKLRHPMLEKGWLLYNEDTWKSAVPTL